MLIMELKAKFLLINSNSSISENEILFEEYLRKIESKHFVYCVFLHKVCLQNFNS